VSSTPDLYASNPTTVRAMQYHEKEAAALAAWVGPSRLKYRPKIHLTQLWVAANESWLPLDEGEWVIQDELGFYPCKDVVFRKKYHKVMNRDDDLRDMKAITLPGSEWDGFEFHMNSEELWLERNGFLDEAATKRWQDITKGYDVVHIDHTK